MARETGIHRRPDSRFWWIATTLPNGQRLRQSTGTENREEAEALLAKIKLDAYRERHFGIKRPRSWQEAVVRYLETKATLRSARDVKRICRGLHPFMESLTLDQINGDVIWSIVQDRMRQGNKPATVNRYLSLLRNLLRTARDEWQWIDSIPKIRMLPGEVERDRWLNREEADRLIRFCPEHLAAVVRYALSTGCRAREILDLEWSRVDLQRKTAWINVTKNGTPRGVPLNRDAVAVLREQMGKHPRYCFTYQGEPIKRNVANHAWYTAVKRAGLEDFRFHDLRHTWASWHRQAGSSCDELKELGGWKTRSMVDRYAKFATDHLREAASRIESAPRENVVELSRFCHGATKERAA